MCTQYLVCINEYIQDDHVAGVSAKKLPTSRALVCDCLADVTPLFSNDTVSDCTAM